MDIRIGSVKAGEQGEYIGRPGRGRFGSPLANPFPVTQGQSRARVIVKYRLWLWDRLRVGDQKVVLELIRLLKLAQRPEGVTLLCWCRGVGEDTPACHGDVIKRALEWLAEDEQRVVALCEPGAVITRIGE
jgi:hypothetical protein